MWHSLVSGLTGGDRDEAMAGHAEGPQYLTPSWVAFIDPAARQQPLQRVCAFLERTNVLCQVSSLKEPVKKASQIRPKWWFVDVRA